GAPPRPKHPVGGADREMGLDAERMGIARVNLGGRVRPAAIDELVEIDREQRRTRPREGLAPPAGIKLEVRLRNDVAPAMVVEVVDRCHSRLPLSATVT